MKYALITGAGRGLGVGFCQVLVDMGYTVFAAMRDTSNFVYTHERVRPIVLDVEDDDTIKKACAEISASGCTIDLLINNAGVSKRSASVGGIEKVTDLEYADRKALLHMFNVNSISPLIIIKHCLPLMSTENTCFIINITSGRASFTNESPNANYGYRASKVALNMFTKALLHDLPKNVQIFAVHPGLVRTDMNPDGDTEPNDAAKNILAIINPWDQSKNGAYLNYDGKIFPN